MADNNGRSNQGFAADPERARRAGREGGLKSGKARHESDQGGSENSSGEGQEGSENRNM
jgi:hypothetical protein